MELVSPNTGLYVFAVLVIAGVAAVILLTNNKKKKV